jgi:hypothetical protein
MKRVSQVLGAVLVLLGLFWAGRESDHGLAAFWEHWWCPTPLAAILVGAVAVLTVRRSSSVA